jgi:Gpi18-like mannosyltransferase
MKLNQLLLPSVLLLFLIVLLCPPNGFLYDIGLFQNWANYIHEFGIGNVYHSGVDYPPAYLYLLKFHRAVFGEQTLEDFSKYIKYYQIVADFIGIFFVLSSVNNKDRMFLHWSMLALNFSFFYNSIRWGQVDGIASTMNFAAILLAYKKQWPAAIGIFVLSVNFKLQSAIYAPLLLLMFINDFNLMNMRKILNIALTGILVQFILIIPFLHLAELNQLMTMATGAVGRYPAISMNAANIWFWLVPNTNLLTAEDTSTFLFMTLRKWGLLMMAVAMLITFYPSMKTVFNSFRKKIKKDLSFDQLMLVAALMPLAFFFFNTEMHERYSHNAWLFIAAWSFSNRNYIPLLLFSISYYLNMESVMSMLYTEGHLFFWSFPFIACLFAILLVYLFGLLYFKKDRIKIVSTI